MGVFNVFAKGLIKSAEETLTTLENKINEFDFDTLTDSVTRSVNAASERLNTEMERLTKTIKNYTDKWVVEENFNIETDRITVKVENGTLIVDVVTETDENTSSSHNLTVTIPDDVDASTMKQRYDKEAKKAIFIFNKKIS